MISRRRIVISALLIASGHVLAVDTSAPEAPMDHSHRPIAIPANMPQPAMALGITVDAMSGFNLELKLDHYVLSPPPAAASMAELMSVSVDADSGVLTGHAHLYINGEKVQRIYGKNIHLPAALFQVGVNQISVTINNHGHLHWTKDGKKIIATLFVDINKPEPVLYSFASFPLVLQ